MSKRTRRTFSQEFKQQIVNLYLAGKPRVEIIREYERFCCKVLNLLSNKVE